MNPEPRAERGIQPRCNYIPGFRIPNFLHGFQHPLATARDSAHYLSEVVKILPAEAVTLDPIAAIVVLITASSVAEARQLADLLVEEKLAACVQILPSIDSVYRWKGAVERASEVLLMAKTSGSRFPELETRVRSVHSYETPEIVAIPVTAISLPYLEWLAESIDSQPD